MTVIEIPIGQIKPYEKNARFNEQAIPKVAESIKKYGFKVPVVVDKNNVIITGHTRVEACKLLGITKVPCVIASDLTDDQVREFRLVDNRVHEFAQWDYDKLIQELDDLDLSDLTDFEFPEFEYEDIISKSDLEDLLTDGIKTSDRHDKLVNDNPDDGRKRNREKQHSINVYLNPDDDVTGLLQYLDEHGFVYKEF